MEVFGIERVILDKSILELSQLGKSYNPKVTNSRIRDLDKIPD